MSEYDEGGYRIAGDLSKVDGIEHERRIFELEQMAIDNGLSKEIEDELLRYHGPGQLYAHYIQFLRPIQRLAWEVLSGLKLREWKKARSK